MVSNETQEQLERSSKLRELRALLEELESVVVAFSGGVDSSFLLSVAADVLGTGRTVAVTIGSPLNPPGELDEATRLAHEIGVEHVIVEMNVLSEEGIAANPPDRCYHCKRRVFEELAAIADAKGIRQIIHGEHADDLGERRPGSRAAKEMGIRSPLAEAGLSKEDIRALSRQMGLEGWDRPSTACLATRVPYGEELTREKLERIAAAENALHELGFGQLRVRDHGEVARIEVPAEDIGEVAQEQQRRQIVSGIKEAGYNYVALDLEGFRSGSADEVI